MATVGQRIRQRWLKARYNQRALWRAITGRKEYPFTFPTWRQHDPIPSLVNFETFVSDGYNRNELVYACISLVASNAPNAPMKAWRMVDDSPVPVDLPLIELLDRPNPRQSRFEFNEMIHTYLNIEGNAFAVKQPDELWLARPDRMHQVIKNNELMGYVYITEGRSRIPFLVDEIVHTKMPNPGDPYDGLGRGLPPLNAAAHATDIDNKATDFLKAFFDNAAVPYGMLTTKNILEDDEVVRIRERLKEQYSSSSKWHEIMILDAEASYQKLGADISEIAWPDLRRVTESRICMTFKVPPIMVGAQVGLERSTFANTEQSERMLWRHKIIPDNKRVASAFTTAYMDEIPDGVWLEHDYVGIEILQESRNEKFTRAQQGAAGGWLTVNDARAEVGLKPVDSGDIFLRPIMVQAIDAAATVEELTEEPEQREEEPEERGRKALDELGSRFHKSFDLIARSWEARFLEASRDQFAKELVEMQAILGSKRRKDASTFIEFDKAMAEYMDMHGIEAWELLFLPLFAGLMEDQALLLAETLGIVAWDVANPEVQAFISNYSFKFANGLGATTKESLRGLVASGQAEGWSINKLRDELGGIYGGWDKTRAEMIARTETIRSSNAGAVASYAKAGIEYKQWFTAEDGRVCGYCQEMHNKIVGVSENYWAMGDEMTVEVPDKKPITMTFSYEDVGAPPLHPNCRCTILPVVEEL
jgi:HK97 family phage portal protein